MLKKRYGIFSLALFLFIIDRLAKLWFIKNPIMVKETFSRFLNFHFEINHGIAFGLPINQTFILILNSLIILVLVGIILKVYSRPGLLIILSLSLIVVGAFSNLIDRLRFGFVVDYIDVPFFTVFNLADIIITVGVVLIISQELFFENHK